MPRVGELLLQGEQSAFIKITTTQVSKVQASAIGRRIMSRSKNYLVVSAAPSVQLATNWSDDL